MEIKCGLGYPIHVNTHVDVTFAEGDFVVTDRNVYKIYRHMFEDVAPSHLVVLKAGEKSKTLKSLGRILRAMRKAGCDRGARLVAVGGGVVGDITGFAAAVYLRGVDYVQVPTTLLAMVDSSVGGKTAVDLDGYKNLVGAFKQPVRVEICTDFLRTLPDRELTSGVGEILKTAFLDADLLQFIREHLTAFFAFERDTMREVITRCVAFKADVVTKDERESGLRKILNLGHTVGHAMETAGHYKLSHGAYVLNGLIVEAKIARLARAIEEDYYKEIVRLCSLALDDRFVKCGKELTAIALADKKNRDGKILCVLPVAPGVTKERAFTETEFSQCLENIV